MLKQMRTLWAAGVVVLALTACGGGGGGGATPPATLMSVSPALGCFADGTAVVVYDSNGTVLDNTSVKSCAAQADVGSYTGPLIFKVSRGSYYSEKHDAYVDYTGTGLVSVAPSVSSGKKYAMNLLTHLVAARAGINPASPTLGTADPAVAAAAIKNAKDDVLSILGIPESLLGDDLFASPTILDGSNTIEGNLSGANLYAALLVDLAFNATGSPGEQADALFALMASSVDSAIDGNDKLQALGSVSGAVLDSLDRLADPSRLPAIGGRKLVGSAHSISVSELAEYRRNAATSVSKIVAEAEAVAGSGEETFNPTPTASIGTQMPTTIAGIVVVPDLGAFGANAVVEVFRASDGLRVGNGVTNNNGMAGLELGDALNSSLVIRVSGRTGVSYFDEGKGKLTDFRDTDELWAVVPATSISNGASYSVNLVTDMAAAFAGVSSSDTKVTPAGGDTVESAILHALAKARLSIGLGAASGNALIPMLINPLAMGDAVNAIDDRVDTSRLGGYWSLAFSEMASAAVNSVTVTDMRGLLQALRAEVRKAVTEDSGLSANSVNVTLLWRAMSQVASDAAYADPCSVLANIGGVRNQLETLFQEANTNAILSPTADELAAVAAELKEVIQAQNTRRQPTALQSVALATCKQ